ncbi:hypothetical protein HU719_006230 [Pseudomonas sp. SWRI107]|uniref:hypothetical protein n=1 Tax=Pseudomonas farsensis TaxID=2745492 RepID=UPI001647647C|nr:hypothetical protein [Pseudomonas farsensis]MBV4531002.1 hypothetical protein [Pseudomonas farsensis]
MARKQEKPEAAVEVQDAASASQPVNGKSEGGVLPLPTEVTLSPGTGEDGASVAAPALAANLAPQQQEIAGREPNVGAEGLVAASNPSAVVAGDPAESVRDEPVEGIAGDGLDESVVEERVLDNLNPVALQIYPMRSYMDEGELRRRGGPAYSVPRRHAEELMERKLASLHPLKE